MRNPAIGMLRSIFAFTALLATAGVHAQAQTSISVQAATNVFNQILGVSFAAGSTTVLNTDEASRHRLESLTFVTNPNTFFVDLLAADNGGNILRYATDFTCQPPQSCTTGTVVSQAAAIGNPNGLSADAFGNVFALNNAPGISPQPQVWAVPTDGNGGYLPAVTIDTTSPAGSLLKPQAVVETMIVRTPLGTSPFTLTSAPPSGPGYTGGTLTAAWPNFTGANYQITLSTGQSITACTFTSRSTTFTCPSTNITDTPTTTINVPLLNVGDLLVVSQAPDEILLYPGNAGAGPLSANHSPTVLIPQCSVQPVCIPAGSTPGGIAVWPADNSLLVTTFGGSILRFGTSGGAITQGQPVSGLPAGNLYKINSALAGGGPVAYVAQSSPGNHGSILELSPPANNPNGIQFFASVTAPGSVQGIAATNTVQAPEGNCLAANGCDLFGDKLNKHTVMPVPGGPPLTASNVVESLCFVAQDPRVSTAGIFNNQPLKVNDVCPGFDDTNGVNPMTIPGFARGGSGSGSAFALIKTQTANDQFNATYVHTEQDPNALFPNANNPVCGANGTGVGLWGPRAGEGLIAEEGVNIVNPGNANPMPTLVEAGDGCGSGTIGTHKMSIFTSGLELALPGGNTPANLQAFVQQKYSNLLTTITELSAGQNPNVSAAVASQLTNQNGTGCVDLSLSLFNKAMGEIPPQQTADFQDAADLLTNADTTGATTCDSIVTTNAYVPGAFQETLPPLPQGAAPVYNPSGQLRWRFANISNAITMRILTEAPASSWPTPVGLSVSPQYMFAQCVATGCPPQQNPSTATLSWALVHGASNCTWKDTTDLNFKPSPPQPDPLATHSVKVGPFTTAGTTYLYKLTCNVPAGTVPPGGTTMSVSTYLTVWPAVVVIPIPQSVVAGQSVQVNWTPPAGATACTLAFSGQGSFKTGSTTFVKGPTTGTPYAASYLSNQQDVKQGVRFAATCTAGASAGIASITVTHN